MVAVEKANDAVAFVPSVKLSVAPGDRLFTDGDRDSNFQPAPADEHDTILGFVFRNLVNEDWKHTRLPAPSRGAIRGQKPPSVKTQLTQLLGRFEQPWLISKTRPFNPQDARQGGDQPPPPAPFNAGE